MVLCKYLNSSCRNNTYIPQKLDSSSAHHLHQDLKLWRSWIKLVFQKHKHYGRDPSRIFCWGLLSSFFLFLLWVKYGSALQWFCIQLLKDYAAKYTFVHSLAIEINISSYRYLFYSLLGEICASDGSIDLRSSNLLCDSSFSFWSN